MNVKNTISTEILAGVTLMLKRYVPELNSENLIAALKNYTPSSATVAPKFERPLKISEAAVLLGVTKPTINRYLNNGKLQRIKVNRSTVRVSPDSVYSLLNQTDNRISVISAAS